jgi:hypothetical protein
LTNGPEPPKNPADRVSGRSWISDPDRKTLIQKD